MLKIAVTKDLVWCEKIGLVRSRCCHPGMRSKPKRKKQCKNVSVKKRIVCAS
jgi:hypothetical protein